MNRHGRICLPTTKRKYRQMNEKTDGGTNRQIDGSTDRRADGNTDRQTQYKPHTISLLIDHKILSCGVQYIQP